MTQYVTSTEINDIVQEQRICPPAGSEARGASSWKRDGSRAKDALLVVCTARAHKESAETSAEMWIIYSTPSNQQIHPPPLRRCYTQHITEEEEDIVEDMDGALALSDQHHTPAAIGTATPAESRTQLATAQRTKRNQVASAAQT